MFQPHVGVVVCQDGTIISKPGFLNQLVEAVCVVVQTSNDKEEIVRAVFEVDNLFHFSVIPMVADVCTLQKTFPVIPS